MIIPLPYSPGTFEKYYEQFGRDPKSAFVAISLVIARRLYVQTEVRSPSDSFLKQLLEFSWDTVHSEGLPKPLEGNEMGVASELDYSYYTSLVESVLSKLPCHRSEDTLRVFLGQLFTMQLGREFKTCRLSFQEKGSSGECARQSLDNCSDRISGSHCEDCPYFTALSSSQHRKLFVRSYHGESSLDEKNLSILLPEDFRALRLFWHLYIRSV